MKFEDLWERYKQDETHFNMDVARRIYNDRQDEIEELQKRIDDALKELSTVSNNKIIKVRMILNGGENECG